MYVVKRNGAPEPVHFDKITARIANLCTGLDESKIDPVVIAQKVIAGLTNAITTQELDVLASETCAAMGTHHPDFLSLASRISVSNLQKSTFNKFSDAMLFLSRDKPLHPLFVESVHNYRDELDAAIVPERDFTFGYVGFKTLENSYLLRVDKRVIETPQFFMMRVALGIHYLNLCKGVIGINVVLETYDLLSKHMYIHGSPTLFNAGFEKAGLSSCYLVTMEEDSIEGIFNTFKEVAIHSKGSGGIGMSVHNIRAEGSLIHSTNGVSNGLVPMLRVANNIARYVDQGGNKRKGAFAVYLEPWHADIIGFLDLKKNTGKEEMRARDLFYALWIPDLFMKRVENNEKWSLMCPHTCPGLDEKYGDEFVQLYEHYESKGQFVEQINAQDLWSKILASQIETGTPYMMYKDACNSKSNQKELGTIKCGNLCTEVVQYSDRYQTAVCNLASVALPKFVLEDGTFDYMALHYTVQTAVRSLDSVIDVNHYFMEKTKLSNMRNRPVGLGVQGLADMFILMRIPFESDEARVVNRNIFSTIYHAALTSSCQLAKEFGVYDTYDNSPVSKGILQPDMWGIDENEYNKLFDWKKLRADIAEFGIRNSLLVAPMPTATTAAILGNNESFEPYTSNMYTRRLMAGEFQMVNHHLIKDLIKLDIWNEDMRLAIIRNHGSVQSISEIPENVRLLYKTVWEMSQKTLLQMSIDRAPFICQSQSFNLFFDNPTPAKLTSAHFFGWRGGLKTGMYYLRTKAAADAIQFTVPKEKPKDEKQDESVDESESEVKVCLRENGPNCISCSG